MFSESSSELVVDMRGNSQFVLTVFTFVRCDEPSGRNGTIRLTNHTLLVQAEVIERKNNKAYVHYTNSDKRLDEWVDIEALHLLQAENGAETREGRSSRATRAQKRKLEEALDSASESALTPGSHIDSDTLFHDDEERSILEQQRKTYRRNYPQVVFGYWKIKTWCVIRHRSLCADLEQTTQMLVGSADDADEDSAEANLYVCDRCFKYMKDGATWEVHSRTCDVSHPPGRKVYQRGAHTIWEVDGAQQKLYCQNLSLFGKFFIDVKTLFFDCENFMFYVLTDADSRRDHVLGFFSKEKVSYDDYNLACIVILPPYQRKGYGMLLIEFSYELSRRSGKLGTPERPLSDLGLRSYLAYWVAVLVRFFRNNSKVLTVAPAEVVSDASSSSPSSPTTLKRRKRLKGFEGEVSETLAGLPQSSYITLIEEPSFGSFRTTQTTVSEIDGSATTHLTIKCTLMDISKATNLRPEDAAFAMEECGLLSRSEVIVISREMVEAVAAEHKVKPAVLDMAHILS
ncbi:acyl-CoA N-acyltransferase [Cantharellus anzutake]|uniref:acyl-CoA N-acyltransferase n=1 Tax=Cantharellus anzutake TaxID=1750568 RepID=UPI001906989F|nr:acyl-CoA N-acyltransferase [Cantharellus anzutake]KAF8339782.1 acyl-CoA N-acyltransferase [Cantharellus anzutake]